MTLPTTDRAARRQELRDRLAPRVEHTVDQLTDLLLDTPDEQFFGELEFRLRDQAHQLAAAAHQTGLQDRKKGGITVPASTAPTAMPMPALSPTDRARS